MSAILDLFVGLTLTNDNGRARAIADAADLSPGDRVLDIGCGPGLGLVEAAKRGAAPIGLDPSPTMLWLAARRVGRGSAVLLRAAVDAIPLPCQSVNVAWASGSFHHWPDIDAGLAEVRRVLRPDGRLVILERATSGHGPIGSHGVSAPGADELTAKLVAHGFDGPTVDEIDLSRHRFVLVKAGAPLGDLAPAPK